MEGDRASNQQLRHQEAYKGRMTEPQRESCLPHCRAEEVKGGGGLLAHGHAPLVVCLPQIQLFQGEVPALHWQTSYGGSMDISVCFSLDTAVPWPKW